MDERAQTKDEGTMHPLWYSALRPERTRSADWTFLWLCIAVIVLLIAWFIGMAFDIRLLTLLVMVVAGISSLMGFLVAAEWMRSAPVVALIGMITNGVVGLVILYLVLFSST